MKQCVTYLSRFAVQGTLDDTDTESAKDAMLQADSNLEISQNIAKTLVSYFKFYNKKVSAVFLIIFFYIEMKHFSSRCI